LAVVRIHPGRETQHAHGRGLDQPGWCLKAALKAALNGTPWQRCQFHLQQNAQEYVTKQHLKAKVSADIRVIFTAIPQHEENEVLTAFLQRGGGEIWIWPIAGFSGRKLFPE
jgi:hypothetical protein